MEKKLKRKDRSMYNDSEFIRFDWAIKRILRDKANFGVLEGLMTVLIKTDIKILEVLESESNRDSREDKSNRVDVKAKTASGEIVLVEVQLARESHFMQRILFGTSEAIVEQLQVGQDYDNIKKVYSINVLYFDLGAGEDYVYHGTTTFRGLTHPDSILKFNRRESELVTPGASVVSPNEIYPEYFLLRVNQFNEVAKTPIEEWMEYLKKGIIRPDTDAPGLQEARQKLDYMKMTQDERRAYKKFMINVHADRDVMETAKRDGWNEGWDKGMKAGKAEGVKIGKAEGMKAGEEKGKEKGKEIGKIEVAKNMKNLGLPLDVISQATGLTRELIERL